MRWIFSPLLAMLFSASMTNTAAADTPYWELICEPNYGGAILACAVRKPAIMIYSDTDGRRDITLGYEHHASARPGGLEHLQRFRFQLDDGSWIKWRLGYERAATFDATVEQMKRADFIASRHTHLGSRIEYVEVASVDQGFRDAIAEMERQISEASAR